MRVNAEVLEEIERLTGELAAHRAAWLLGGAESRATSHMYGNHPALMLPDTLRELREQAQRDDAVRPLLNAVARAHIEGGCAPAMDRVHDTLDREMLRDLNSKWFFADTDGKIATECDRKHRKVLDQSRRRVLARLEGGFSEAVQQSHTLMVDRGFTGYLAMCAELSGIDLENVLEDADGFLEDSKARYMEVFGEALREAGVFPEDARRHDLIYLFAGHYGPAAGLPGMDEAVNSLSGMGLGPEGVLTDLEARAAKRPGVHLVAESVPAKIHLIARPDGGWQTFAELLGKAGAAALLARTPAGLAYEKRELWHPVVMAAVCAIFESLFGSREWLSTHAPKVKAEGQERRYALWSLHRVRALAGSARFARFLHGPGELADKADAFEHYMHEATGARIERDNFLLETPWFFDQAHALYGGFLAAQVLEVLEERFGPAWFAEPAAGKCLVSGICEGWENPHRFAGSIGVDDPGSIWALTGRLERVLGEFIDED